jgi:hypothetical protein
MREDCHEPAGAEDLDDLADAAEHVRVDFPLLQRLALPITIGAVRYPGIKIHDPRIIRLLEVLLPRKSAMRFPLRPTSRAASMRPNSRCRARATRRRNLTGRLPRPAQPRERNRPEVERIAI